MQVPDGELDELVCRLDHARAARFSGAIGSLAERWLSAVRSTEYERGGHVASLQAPHLLVADVRAWRQALRAANDGLKTSAR
jgi:hypothetical protein